MSFSASTYGAGYSKTKSVATGLKSTSQNADGTVKVTYMDGKSYTTPNIKGAKGDKGDNGIWTEDSIPTDPTKYPIRMREGVNVPTFEDAVCEILDSKKSEFVGTNPIITSRLGDYPLWGVTLHTSTDDCVWQGTTCDKDYLYCFDSLNGKAKKVSKNTNEVVKTVSIGSSVLGHANSACYNVHEKLLYVTTSNGFASDLGVAVLDTELNYLRTVDFKDADGNTIIVDGLSYDAYRKLYIAQVSGYRFMFFDANYNFVRVVDFDHTTEFPSVCVGQSVCCDGKYIYKLYSNIINRNFSIVRVYDYNGNYKTFRFLPKNEEVESICYDYFSGETYIASIDASNTKNQTIRLMTEDSGWIDFSELIDLEGFSESYNKITESAAQFRLEKGTFYMRGTIKVSASGDISKFKPIVNLPMKAKALVMCNASPSGDKDIANGKPTYLQVASYSDTESSMYNKVHSWYCNLSGLTSGTIFLHDVAIRTY